MIMALATMIAFFKPLHPSLFSSSGISSYFLSLFTMLTILSGKCGTNNIRIFWQHKNTHFDENSLSFIAIYFSPVFELLPSAIKSPRSPKSFLIQVWLGNDLFMYKHIFKQALFCLKPLSYKLWSTLFQLPKNDEVCISKFLYIINLDTISQHVVYKALSYVR